MGAEFGLGKDWFTALDTNKDGALSPEEFRAKADEIFAKLDANHDGAIANDEVTAMAGHGGGDYFEILDFVDAATGEFRGLN